MGYSIEQIQATNPKFEMPVYVRHMLNSNCREKYPDRDYSVNRAERRKRNKENRRKECK